MDRILIAGESEILIGRGTLGSLLPERNEREAVAILAQPGSATIAQRLVHRLPPDLRVDVRIVPDGEVAKSLQTASDLYHWLSGLGLTRDDTVAAVGGGACTDLAGFVAATFLRGVEAVYAPTTLLAAVDGAIGGKTGLNLGGKNLIGVFRHPARVVIDLDLLDTIPERLWRDGAVEAVKAGMIGDPDLVGLFEARGREAPLAEIVGRAVAVKATVVEEDFREIGPRMFLNYGHTLGHAFEVAAGLSHGEAVAVGMTAAAHVSARRVGFESADRQKELLASLGLPVTAGGDRDELRRLVGLDKKRKSGGVRMVLLRDIGDPTVEYVDDATVEEAFEAVWEGP